MVFAAHLTGDPGNTPLGILYSSILPSSPDNGNGGAPAAPPLAVSLPDLQAAVAPHVALQLLQGVWQHLQPLIGYIVTDNGAPAATGEGHAGPRVGLLYAEQGMRLPEFMLQNTRRNGDADVASRAHAWPLVVRNPTQPLDSPVHECPWGVCVHNPSQSVRACSSCM